MQSKRPVRFAMIAAAIGLSLLTLAPTAAHAQDDDARAKAETVIRAAREAFNEAMLERETERFSEFLVDDVEVIGGNGTVFHGADAYAAVIDRLAGDPDFVTYVRLPGEIQVDVTGTLGSEDGAWEGTWRGADGETSVRGTYKAQWRQTDDGWRIRAELFVALGCDGPRCEDLVGAR